MEERKSMWVCHHCLMAIESKESYLPTVYHNIELEYDEEDFDKMSKCDWCEENGFDVLYEII